jgi:hypothetical protein
MDASDIPEIFSEYILEFVRAIVARFFLPFRRSSYSYFLIFSKYGRIQRQSKSEQLAALEAHLKAATSVAFTSNTKVTVLEVSALKKDLRAANATLPHCKEDTYSNRI